ncbi:Uncharacterized protein ACO02O_01163 [Dirofilaria immitis]
MSVDFSNFFQQIKVFEEPGIVCVFMKHFSALNCIWRLKSLVTIVMQKAKCIFSYGFIVHCALWCIVTLVFRH